MRHFRTLRPMQVDAEHYDHNATIEANGRMQRVHAGDWVVRGESGETYIVSDEFFQRTFIPDSSGLVPTEAGRHYGC